MRRSPLLPVAAIATSGLMALGALAACGGESNSSSTTEAPSTGSSEATGATSTAIERLPAEIQQAYEGTLALTGESPLISFKSSNPPPWTIGYSSTYSGNTWRTEILQSLEEQTAIYKELGLVDRLLVQESNYDTPTQIQQIQQMVDQGADIIITVAPFPGLEPTIEDLYNKGIPFISLTGSVTSPYAINVGVNFWLTGYQEAKAMIEEIGNEGNLLLVSGVPGSAISDQYDDGAKAAISESPGVTLVDVVPGNWTDSVAKDNLLKWFATNPDDIDGIVVQSAAEYGVIQAVEQSGRPQIPITLAGELSAACYWSKNPGIAKVGFHAWPPKDEAYGAFNVAMRILQGQGPIIQTITREQIPYTLEEVSSALGDPCDESTTDWYNVGPQNWWGNAYLDNFFENPADPTTYTP